MLPSPHDHLTNGSLLRTPFRLGSRTNQKGCDELWMRTAWLMTLRLKSRSLIWLP
jgi:hypothetical protein